MIKAIIFDCFGVLAESSYNNFYRKHLADKPDVVEQIKALDHASNKGSITHDDFYRGVAGLTNMSEHEIRNFMKIAPVNFELLLYIKTELKPKYKISFLSNVADNLMDQLFSEEQQALFDDIVLSFEVNMAKPEVQIFELAANRLDVTADECIFVDDVQEYLDSASTTGMETILYENFPTFKAKLGTILK